MKRALILLAAAAAAGLSCGRTTEPGQRLVRLDLAMDPVRPYFPVGDHARARAIATFSDGLVVPVGDARWRSLQPSVATVDETGTIRMVGRGTATIEAVASDVRASFQVVVRGLYHDVDILADETWLVADTPHVVRAYLQIGVAASARLTIEAGSRVLIRPGGGLTFADYGTGRGRLIVPAGGSPTIFEGDSAAPATWTGITLLGRDTTELHNVILRHCGAVPRTSDETLGCVVAAGSPLVLDDVTVDGAPGPAMTLQAGTEIAAASRRFNVLNSGGPIAKIAPGVVGRFPLGGRYEGNAENAIWIQWGRIEDSTTWRDPGAPLRLVGTVSVGGARLPVLTLAAGFHLRADPAAGIVVGETGAGALVAGDAAGVPVLLESTGAGWAGVEILGSPMGSSLTNVELRDCTLAAGACLRLDGYAADAPYHVRDVTVSGSRGDGVHIGLPRFDAASGNLTVTRCAGVPLDLAGDEVPFIPSGDYRGNDTDAVRIRWGAVTENATWHDLGMPYLLPEGLAVGNIDGPRALTLDSGVVLRMGAGSRLSVGSTLRALGTAASPVIFESATPGVAGAWQGIEFGYDIDPTSLISHAEVRDAGAGTPGYFGAIRLWADPGGIVRNTTIRRSSNCGIVMVEGTWTDDYTDPAYGNAFVDVAGPAVCRVVF